MLPLHLLTQCMCHSGASNECMAKDSILKYAEGSSIDKAAWCNKLHSQRSVYTGADGRKIYGCFNISDYPSPSAALPGRDQNAEEEIKAEEQMENVSLCGAKQYNRCFNETGCIGKGVIIIWPDKRVYFGDVLQGKMHGQGVLHWGDGSAYKGSFVNDYIEGEGRLQIHLNEKPTDVVIEGGWTKNRFICQSEGIPEKYTSLTTGRLLEEPFMLVFGDDPQYDEWKEIKEMAMNNIDAVNPVTEEKLIYPHVRMQGVDYHLQEEITRWMQQNTVHIVDIIESAMSGLFAIRNELSVDDKSHVHDSATETSVTDITVTTTVGDIKRDRPYKRGEASNLHIKR